MFIKDINEMVEFITDWLDPKAGAPRDIQIIQNSIYVDGLLVGFKRDINSPIINANVLPKRKSNYTKSDDAFCMNIDAEMLEFVDTNCQIISCDHHIYFEK